MDTLNATQAPDTSPTDIPIYGMSISNGAETPNGQEAPEITARLIVGMPVGRP